MVTRAHFRCKQRAIPNRPRSNVSAVQISRQRPDGVLKAGVIAELMAG
jgi:hypothetical protein